MSIRKWIGGTIRPDRLETDSVTTTTLNGGGVFSEGDGTERQIWIIPNGTSDPAGADPEDIIFEEQ